MKLYDTIEVDYKLLNLETRFVPEYGHFVLDMHYQLENEKEVRDLYLTGVQLPFGNGKSVAIERVRGNMDCSMYGFDDTLPIGDYLVVPDRMKVDDIKVEVTKKQVEYTMEELEDILGCKVKIVKEKEDE